MSDLIYKALSVNILVNYCKDSSHEVKDVESLLNKEKMNAFDFTCQKHWGLNYFLVSNWEDENKVGVIAAVITPKSGFLFPSEAERVVIDKVLLFWPDYNPEDVRTETMACDPETGKPFGYVTSWIQWINEVK